MPKPDWNAIRSEYITTTISYRKLAEEWDVSFRTLSDRAKREGWADARHNHRDNVVKKTVQKVAAATAADNASKLVRLQQAADSMSKVIEDIFTDTEQFKRHIIQTRDGDIWDADCRVMDKVDTKAIKDLTGALKDLAAVMRSIYDLPTVTEQSAMDIAAQRLALDKAKADMGGSDDEESGVVELSPILEDNHE